MTDAEETRALLALNLIPGIGSTHIQRLLGFFGSAREVLQASHRQLANVAGLSPGIIERLTKEKQHISADQELELVAKHDCDLLTLHDSAYPEALRNIYDPPPILYVKGKLIEEDAEAIAVVGTRHPSRYGRLATEQLTRELVNAGFTIVSGLARGVDGIAHRTALESGGRTIAVLGNGLSRIYPEEHTELAEQIASQGALLSEFAMQAPPLATHFPQRNRVLSGLSLGVLITEAAERSGSLITARLALEQGREVFAIPGEIQARGSRGPHQLIQQGAALVTSAEDIMHALPAYTVPANVAFHDTPRQLPELNPEESDIWNALGTTSMHIDTIIQEVAMPPARVASILVMMELKGMVQQLPGKVFARKSQMPGT